MIKINCVPIILCLIHLKTTCAIWCNDDEEGAFNKMEKIGPLGQSNKKKWNKIK